MAFILSKYVPLFLFPLGLSLVILVVTLGCLWGAGFRYRKKKMATLVGACLLMLWLAGSPFFAERLMSTLEGRYVSKEATAYPNGGAIVVLSGGTTDQHRGSRMVSPGRAFDRLYLGCRLYLSKKAPLMILSGGAITRLRQNGSLTESQLMSVLARQQGIPEKALVIESHSRNTRENAWFTREIFRDRDWNGKVLLVTSAFHMPRARACFADVGLSVVPCPADFRIDPYKRTSAIDFLPDADALAMTTTALREYIGMIYYRLRGWI